jgi:hypothetical protein
MNQKPTTKFASACGKVNIFVENDMPIGIFHDFLMEIKGLMVDRMVIAHQEQAAQAKAMAQEELPAHESELPSEVCEYHNIAEDAKGE